MTVSRIRAEFEAEVRGKLEAEADPDDGFEGVPKLQPAASAQEDPPEDSDEPHGDETSITDMTDAHHHAVDIAVGASQLLQAAKDFHKTTKQGRAKIKSHAGDDFSEVVQNADDLLKFAGDALEAAKVLAAGAAAAVKNESGERIAS